jgi:type I restriction-modification system DNA methylase subunit
MNNKHKDNLIKLIQQLSYRHQIWQVFSDFLELSALAISNSVDWPQREEREKKYSDIIARYDPKEQQIFPELFGELVLALEDPLIDDGPEDILGWVFHELELHNKWKGQFFTPNSICVAMGEIAVSDHDKTIQDHGFITVSEPCAGSGALVLGLANAMKRKGYNYCSQMVVTAVDIDIKCVHMAYLQLSLYGIPAVVIHGDTLAVKEYSRWYTPVYILDGWDWKQKCGMTTHSKENETAEEPILEAPQPLKEATVMPLRMPERTKKKVKAEQIPLIDLGEYEDNIRKNAG